MGSFPSPTKDYLEETFSLDKKLIGKPADTFFMREAAPYLKDWIMQGALLVVDRPLNACDGLLLYASGGIARRPSPQPKPAYHRHTAWKKTLAKMAGIILSCLYPSIY